MKEGAESRGGQRTERRETCAGWGRGAGRYFYSSPGRIRCRGEEEEEEAQLILQIQTDIETEGAEHRWSSCER